MMHPVVIVLGLASLVVLLPLTLTVFNILVWRRGRPDGKIDGTVSILIPARNEARNIDACLAAVQANQHPVLEILVYDDASTDDTADRVLARAEDDPRIRVLRGRDLPRGWVGKSHGCHRLALAARGDVLLFVDADVRLEADGIARLGSQFEDLSADLVSAVPRQQMRTWAERLVVPLLHLTYTSWLPLPLVYASRDPRFLAVNGQVLAIRRSTYESVGGFSAVKNSVVEDMAFCSLVKKSGFRVTFVDGFRIARCRMYSGAREVWEGFSKNLYRGLGAKPVALMSVLALYIISFLAPYGVALFAWTARTMGWTLSFDVNTVLLAATVGVCANFVLRAVLAWRFHHPWSGVLLQPASVLALVAIGINSFIWHQRGTIRWRGRVYGSQSELTTTAPRAH